MPFLKAMKPADTDAGNDPDNKPSVLPKSMGETPEMNLSGHLLVAMPGLADPQFRQSVVLICEHTTQGALGLVLNRTMDLPVNGVLEQLDCPHPMVPEYRAVHWGGPVATERGFVLHEGAGEDWDSTMLLNAEADLHLTTSRDILKAIGSGENAPRHWLLLLGYAGWSPGQLEEEMADNTWLHAPLNTDILFSTDSEARWSAATRLLGVDPARLSGASGRA